MAVFAVNLTIYTGTDFDQTFILSNDDETLLDLDGYTIESKMKRHGGSKTSIDLNPSIDNIFDGRIHLSLSGDQTKVLLAGRYYYDILITKNNITKKVVEGEVLVKKSITRY